ncbi:hypothetical protein [Bacillus sp. ISL-46]|uniref:hypothetical protein n=1 Tax=Bacillus sp. ISL-46 TaxID=2819129 RepID=UPI001BE82CCB|nr:hypothetical protein [Bacillus sp. ISL-46]MBT2721422.1 hypothetical protein [Bacillus sp. ISL-46]
MLYEDSTLDEAIKIAGFEHNVYAEIFPFEKVFLNKNALTPEGNFKFPLAAFKIDKLIEMGYVRTIKENGTRKISAYDVAKISLEHELITKNYYNMLDFVFLLTNERTKSRKHYYELIKNLGDLNLIDVVYLLPGNEVQKWNKYILKSSVTTFLDNYYNFTGIIDKFGVLEKEIQSRMSDLEEKVGVINATKHGGSYHFRFVKKEDFDHFWKYHWSYKNEFISELQISKELNLAQTTAEKAIKHYHIFPVLIKDTERKETSTIREWNGRNFYHPFDLQFLKRQQNNLWQYYCANYYTSREFEDLLKEELNLADSSREVYERTYFNDFRNNEDTRVFNPYLIRLNVDGRDFQGVTYLYKKELIDNYIEDMKLRSDFLEISEMHIDEPYVGYIRLNRLLEINFPNGSNETVELWDSFVRKGLEDRDNNEISRIIREYVKVAKFLAELLRTYRKDIGYMTTSELKLAIFNKLVLGYIQRYLYSFLLAVTSFYIGKGERVQYDLELVDNPNVITGSPIKEVYAEEEYGAYCNYVNEITLHKQNAIQDIECLLAGDNQNYKNYASTWLYIIIHLNNKWRRFETTLFPAFKDGLAKTNLLKNCNFDYRRALLLLKNNDLEDEDIEYIANQLRAFQAIHHKNKAPRDFNWTEPTAKALSTAIVLCQIRSKLETVKSKSLIDFDTKIRRLPERSEKAFFKSLENYNSNKFGSLKMNRTVSSLSFAAGRELGHEGALETVQSFRHKQKESTNIYITITRERLDEISKQLFNAGPFGSVYTSLMSILIGRKQLKENTILSPSEKQMYITQLKNVFGDWIKIEEITRTFHELEKNQEVANKVLNNMSQEELSLLYKKLNMGINHAKDEGFMCIYNDCIYDKETRDKKRCVMCPFMVMNFHSLTNLSSDLKELLELCHKKFKNGSNVSEGDKLYFTRLITVYRFRIIEAIKRFGEDIVSMFFSEYFEKGLEGARDSMRNLPPLSKYKNILEKIDSEKEG